ncbi:DUF262 domain-containing protein [Rhizobium sp. BK176]|uniref:GmrSD restriction endonuclease domain-containing protein n=1 Tax=Rhizobium sp. BK176 TaxID=2587071 RepID=UPI0021695D47|nr:DUF262 domain-containing protein [Rhizobium sp. BK176]MCS4089301.1 hypothetical protein [Rhizobium sp. BK176]
MSYTRRAIPRQTVDTRRWGLQKILREIHSGSIQLPDLQRPWCWTQDNILNLVETIAEGQNFGVPMLLETGGSTKFGFRPLEGTDETAGDNDHPDYYVLDGQQRLTTSYQALLSKAPIRIESTKNGTKARFAHLYFNMEGAVRSDKPMIDALTFVRTDPRGVQIDRSAPNLSDPEYQYEYGYFPVNRIFEFDEWYGDADRFWSSQENFSKPERQRVLTAIRDFQTVVYQTFMNYHVNVQVMDRETPPEAISKQYEKMNTMGQPLGVFDLAIARFAPHGFDLGKDWKKHKARLVTDTRDVLSAITPKQFLHANLMVANHEFGRASNDVLQLDLDDYKKLNERVASAFVDTYNFLLEQGVFKKRQLPPTILVTGLAITICVLGRRATALDARKKLARWLWCCTFSNCHTKNGDTGVAGELPSLLKWITDDQAAPASVAKFGITLATIATATNGSIQNALMTGLFRAEVRDFGTNNKMSLQQFVDGNYDIHHIFTKKWCAANGISDDRCNSVINKTLLAKKTNILLSGSAPSEYLVKLGTDFKVDDTAIDASLRTHGIDPVSMRHDDFVAFEQSRLEFLKRIVEQDTGREVIIAREVDDEFNIYGLKDGEVLPENCSWVMTSRGQSVAYLRKDDGKYYVIKGSKAAPDTTPSLDNTYHEQREKLITGGMLEQQHDLRWLLTEDIEVASPSAAFSIFAGQKAVGSSWKGLDGAVARP